MLAPGSIGDDEIDAGAVSDIRAKLHTVDIDDLKWLSKAIGEIYIADDGVAGVDIPPKDSALFRFIDLTAGLTGAGAYNEGCLSGESLTGAAPAVVATAVVALAGSPMAGKTIRLLNSERRFIRSGNAGTLQDDALQNLTGAFASTGGDYTNATGVFDSAITAQRRQGTTAATDAGGLSFDASRVARTAIETRPRNIGVRLFRRIK